MQPSQSGIDQNQAQRRFKLAVLFGFSGFVAIFVLWWMFTRAYIEIQTQTDSNGEINYQLLKQSDRKKTEVKQTDKTLKKQVAKDSYEITVRQDKANFFSVTTTGGLFSTTAVDAKLQPEKARRFIGNKPGSCTHVIASVLLSYECVGNSDSLQTHIPATATAPTLTRPTFGGGEDIIEGIIRTSKGEDILVSYEAVLAGHEEFAEENHSPHVAFRIQGDPLGSLDLVDRTPLNSLNEDIHSIVAYKDGFVAYNKPVTQALYYSSLESNPTQLPVEDLKNDGLTPRFFSVQGDAYVVGYSNEKDELTTVVVYQDNQPKRYGFDKPLNAARVCAQDTLCTVNEDGLDVYDIQTENSELLYHVGEVTAIGNLGGNNHLVAVRKKDVLELDIPKRTGAIQYTFGNYKFCGIQFLDDSYTLCVQNRDGGKSILAINQQQASDDIDKKIDELMSLELVETVSAYGDFITIEPNPGDPIPSPTGRGFAFNPRIVNRAKTQINQKLEELGLKDQTKYKISNTLE